MGNEMGNNNVSGLQENENDKFEAPRKSSEVHITMSGDDNVNADDQLVSSSKEDFHESGENLLSGNTSLIGDSHTGMEVSARTDKSVEQEPDGFSNDLLKFNGKETESFSSSENGLVDQLHSASEKISVSTVQELIEPENAKVQAALETNEIQGLDGSPKELVSDNTNDEGTCSVVSTEGGRYYEGDPVSEDNLSKTSSDQIQEQLSTPTDPAESSALFASNGTEHEIIKSVSSPTNGYFNEMTSASKEDTSGTSDQKVQKQTSMEREDEELMNLSPNTTPTSESIDSITLSEELKPDNLDAEPFGKDGMILKRCDKGTLGLSEPHDIEEKEKVFENEKTDVVNGTLRHITSSEVGKLRDDMQIEEINFEDDTLAHKESEPFNSSEDRYADEIASTTEKNPAQASDSRTQDHREVEELINSSPNTTPTSGSIKSINLSEELKPDNLDAESFGKDGMILKKIDERTLGLSEPCDIEEKEKVFENETTDAVDRSLQHITSSEIEKLKDGMQIEEIKIEEDTLVYKESEPFTSSKDGFVDEIASISEKNLPQTSESRTQDHIEPETTEVQVLHGSPRTQLVLNDSKDEGTPPVLSSEGGRFYTTTAAFDENRPKTSDDLREISTKTDDAESSEELTSNELKDEDTQSAPSPEDGCSVEIVTAAQENVLGTTDHKVHKETLNGKDDVESSIELMRHDLKDEDTQSASSAGDGCSVEIVTAAEENVLETIDHKIHKETLNGKEGKELMNLSPKTSLNQLDSELTESILNDQLKSVGAESYKEDGEILQGTDQGTLGNSGPHDTEKENELEYERQHAQDEGALPIHNSDAEKPGDGMQREEIKSLDNALLDNSKAEEMLRIKTGVHVEETLKTGLGLNEQQSLSMELDRRLSMDSQLKVVPLVRLPEALQVENTKSEDKFVVLTDNTILFENGNGVEHNKESTNFILHSESEETKVDKFASAESSSAVVVVKALANEGEARTYLGKDVEETEIVNPVPFHSDSNEPDRTYSVHLVQNESTDADQNLTAIAPNMAVNGINSNSELKKEKSIEADAHKSSTLHARLSTLMELATLGISRDQCQIQENISKASDSTRGHESKMKLGSFDSKEGYTTSNEQKNLSPTVDAHTKSSFHVDSQIADIFVIERQQAEEMNKKEADMVFTTSTVEDKHDFGRFSTETFSADANIDGEVPTNGRGEVPDQSPPKYEEKTINSEVLKPNCYVSDVSANQTGVGTGSPCTETDFSVHKEVKEYSVEKLSQVQTTEEKKLLASGRISTEKLNMPLLSYLKEESAGSQHKQEKLVAKKATKNKRSSHDDKHSGSTTQGREKRKPKPLFFGICMCCTAEIL